MKRERIGWKDAGVDRVTLEPDEVQPVFQKAYNPDNVRDWLTQCQDFASDIIKHDDNEADTRDARAMQMHASTLLADMDKQPDIRSVIYRTALLRSAESRIKYRRRNRPGKKEAGIASGNQRSADYIVTCYEHFLEEGKIPKHKIVAKIAEDSRKSKDAIRKTLNRHGVSLKNRT